MKIIHYDGCENDHDHEDIVLQIEDERAEEAAIMDQEGRDDD